jgi:hypothetical protein
MEEEWMARPIWSQLPQRLEVLIREGEMPDRPSPAELNAVLNDFEARAGFQLPASYREFMHWFGPGALSSWFLLCGPIPPRFRELVADVFDMDNQQEMLQDPEGYWASSVQPEVLRRLVLFASTEGGDWFFWDTNDVRNPERREYGIYAHSHSISDAAVELMATSFEEFVTDIALAERYPFSDEERSPAWTLRPAWPPMHN